MSITSLSVEKDILLSIGQPASLNRFDEKPNPDSFPSSIRVNYINCYEDNLTIFTVETAIMGCFSFLCCVNSSGSFCISHTMNRLGAMATWWRVWCGPDRHGSEEMLRDHRDQVLMEELTQFISSTVTFCPLVGCEWREEDYYCWNKQQVAVTSQDTSVHFLHDLVQSSQILKSTSPVLFPICCSELLFFKNITIADVELQTAMMFSVLTMRQISCSYPILNPDPTGFPLALRGDVCWCSRSTWEEFAQKCWMLSQPV